MKTQSDILSLFIDGVWPGAICQPSQPPITETQNKIKYFPHSLD